MKKFILKGMVLGLGVYLMALLQTVTFAVDKTFIDYFPDPEFAKNVAAHVGKPVGSVVIQEELDKVVNYYDRWNADIESIEGIRYLRNLQSFTSYGTGIKKVPSEIGALTQLKELHLYDNEIGEISAEIGELPQLILLNLGGNEIEEIPEEIGKLSQLKELNLGGNEIGEIPVEIGELSQLKELDLFGNEIEEIPLEIGKLSQLKKLYLTGNQIAEIPLEIGELSKLSKLYLDGNAIKEIPEEIGKLSQLIELGLYTNEIVEIPENLCNLKELQYLNLGQNAIKKIPEGLGDLPKLTYLDLSDNQIEVIPANISNVVLGKMDSGWDNLLNLNGNLIKELPDSFGTTDSSMMDLSRNQLTRLPDSFSTVQLGGTSYYMLVNQQIQLNPISVLKDETITSEMLVPEIVMQLTEYPLNKEDFGNDEKGFGYWEIVTPDQQVLTCEDQNGIEDMSKMFQECGTYIVRYIGRYLDFRYYHAIVSGDISSSISVTVLPEQKKTHQVDVTVRYLDDARPEETKSYTVDEGEAFEQQIDVLDGYALANMGLFRAFFDFDYDTDRNVVSLSPVDADHSILLEFDKAQYRVRLKTTYLDGSQADNTKVSWIPFEEDYQQSYQIAEGYEIANLDQLTAAGYEVDETNKTVHIGAIIQNYDITLQFQRKSCEVIVRVVYEDGAYPDQVSTYPVLYGNPFKGDFSYDENYAIRKVSFNAIGVSVNRISKQINIGSVTDSVEITIIVR